MDRIREVLRLRVGMQLSVREVAASAKVGKTTVRDMMLRAEQAGIGWPVPEGVDERALYAALYPARAGVSVGRVEPDWAWVHRELRRKGVTRRLLWEEFQQEHPDGIGYTEFCTRYRQATGSLEVTMRQVHPAGERMMVDYAGMTVDVMDRGTGISKKAQIFVATLAASGYTYADATFSQDERDWLSSHVRALTFFGGVPRVVVPDNLKSGVTSPSYYDPEINRAYADLAGHYGFAVIPARVRRPKDKAQVERHVQVVERRVLAPMRNRQFFNLTELNRAIWAALAVVNATPFQKLEGSRLALYRALDLPALSPLPAEPYEYAAWSKARVNLDYHVEVDHNFYSVPYRFAHKQVTVRLQQRTVELLFASERIASHVRVTGSRGRYTTLTEHMPKSHQRYKNRTPSRLIEEAGGFGPKTQQLVQTVLESRPHPEQGFRTCLGILRAARRYSSVRVEAAAQFCLERRIYSSRTLSLVLKAGGDLLLKTRDATDTAGIVHDNLRGAEYYTSSATGGDGPC